MSEGTTARARAATPAPAPREWPLPAPPPRTRRPSAAGLLRALLDAVLLVVAAVLTGVGSERALGPSWDAVLVLLTLLALGSLGAYRSRAQAPLGERLRQVLTATSLASLAVTAPALVLFGRTGAGDPMVVHWAVTTGLLGAERLALHALGRAWHARRGHARRTLIVGAGEVGRLAARRLVDEPQLGLTPIGFLDKDPLFDGENGARGAQTPMLPLLGASWDVDRVLAEHRVEQVIVAFSTAPHDVLLQIVRACWARDVPVMVVPRLYEVEGRRAQIEHVGALPLIRLMPSDPSGWRFSVKYAIDRVVAAVLLALVSPVLAAVALALLVSMGRPLLFRQRRVGRDGREFEMLKFRTLRGSPTEDGELDARWAAAVIGPEPAGARPAAASPTGDDGRVTRVGNALRTCSLDELPQLWNVLRGDMSLVGPRPERTHYVMRFRDAVPRYPERHRVKSGLTGWAQINGLRGETSLHDRVEWDNFYIENWSPWLDLRILALTIPALLGRRRRAGR